ncbi:MAG: hypothetical protein GXY44_17000 [Phycisphaerales bacterium]|nr:hypothetical protein [Phycisphaerales bacterium]
MSTWKRGHACLTACVVAVLCGTLVAADAIDMQARTKELQNLRWGMFICWSFSTFSDKEWTGGVKDIAFFQATEVDTDQWVRTAKEAEMGYILFLTKHHDGFCLWDTKTTDRKVTNAPLGRDVLAEVKAACDKYGLKLALYYSEGDWTWPGAVDGKIRYEGVGLNPEEKKAQLRELLTQYGPIEYIWFDYAVGDGGVSHADTIAFCKAFQPGCFIGFNNGDQEGSDIRLGERGRPGRLEDHSAAGPHMDSGPSTAYRLAEFTYPILPPPADHARWFYTSPENDGLVHSPEKIYRDYLGAVKYGNIFALNVGPDRQGRLRNIDVATLRTVGEMIRTKTPNPDIHAYGIDLNMEPGGSTCFATPGLWAEADPAAHVAWYETLGANVILTPAVSSNGYAWYKGGAIPAQPGLKHDFLPEVVRLGHEKHMRVIGSFRIAANTRWGGEHPDLSYGTPHDRHLPLTTGYLDYLAAAIEEALTKTNLN